MNQKPVAAFTSLECRADGDLRRLGLDRPGRLDRQSWAWDFGDSSTGSGSKPNHPYAAAGTYPVKLTVTDDHGATDVVTHDVTVTAPPTDPLLASDDFDRTVTSAWGTADVGRRLDAPRHGVAVQRRRQRRTHPDPCRSTLYADLNSVSSQSSRMTAEFSVDKLSEGTYVSLVGRQVGTENYVARLRLQADGGAKLYLLRGSGTALGTFYTPNLTFAPGERYRLSLEVKGTSPTSVSAKIWKASDAEPAGWQRSATDSFAALQAPGGSGSSATCPRAPPTPRSR